LEYQLNTDAKIKISHKICDYKIQHYFEQFCLDQLKNVLFKQHFYFIPFSENISANFSSQNYSTRSKSFVRKKLRGSVFFDGGVGGQFFFASVFNVLVFLTCLLI
jgi:hypothetical protein